MKFVKSLAAAAVAAPLALAGTQALAAPVALELTLVIDTSGSIDASEFALQKTGYVNAFKNAGIHNLIQNFTSGDGIAVRAVRFSTSASVLVEWTLLNSAASSIAFADALAAALGAGPGSGETDIRDGLVMALAGHAAANGFEGRRQVIDVSGDGAQNESTDEGCTSGQPICATLVATQRDAAAAVGITVNGLVILGQTGLQTFYETNVKTADGFVVAADGFADFEAAIIRKIGREITGEVPAPATLAVFGAALLGLAGLRRRA